MSEWVELTSNDGAKVLVNLALASTIRRFTTYTSISFSAGAGTIDVRETPSEIAGLLNAQTRAVRAQ